MNIELINTGSELLLGHVVNTHLRSIAERIFPLGLRIERQVCVPDGEAIRDAMRDAITRADVVIVTGGLGPTSDDITREITADLLGREMHIDESVIDAITERFARRNFKVTENNRRQAMVPTGAEVLHNPNGTAPGLYFPAGEDHPAIFLLPGPPRELLPMLDADVLPRLSALLPDRPETNIRTYRLTAIGESHVENLVDAPLAAIPGLEHGYCARPSEVDVRVIGNPNALAAAHEIVMSHLAEKVFSENNENLEKVIVHRLQKTAQTLAIAESCTGGTIANRITNVPGASDVFLAGYVTYANAAKSATLGVPAELIAEHGAVSEEVARAMAEGALHASGADFAISTTGIAGPGGGTVDKPIGTVYIGMAAKDGQTTAERFQFATDRETFKWVVSESALFKLWNAG